MSTQHALQEIQYNIKQKDLIKARLVMDHFSQIDSKEQKAIINELYAAEDGFAVQVLCYLAVKHQGCTDEFPDLANIILTKAAGSPDTVIEGIAGESLEKHYLISLAGELDLQSSVQSLIDEMLRTHEKTDQIAILTSLGSLGNPEAIEAVSEFLYVDDFELLAAAIRAMGKIGTHEAIQSLSVLLGKDLKTDLMVLDVFASQQNEFSLIKLNEALDASSVQIRNHARVRLIKIGAKAVPILIDNLFTKNVDHQIITLNILQEIGDESAALAVRKLINQKPSEPNVRFAAYETLAELSNRKGDYVLANGLTDTDSSVRLAATKAIDRNLDPALTMGVMNMLESSGNEAEWITKAIIDTQARNLFMGLIKSDKFITNATNYLIGDVHHEIRTFFVQFLEQEGEAELADKIKNKAQKKQVVKGRVCAVDDSKMILSIYRSVITKLGYEAVLFSLPSEAIDWLMKEKPDYLCTDLNMPDITGVELIQQVRKKYSKDELPVFLVTTQDEVQDNASALEAGVSEILQKPFNVEKISAVFKKFGTR